MSGILHSRECSSTPASLTGRTEGRTGLRRGGGGAEHTQRSRRERAAAARAVRCTAVERLHCALNPPPSVEFIHPSLARWTSLAPFLPSFLFAEVCVGVQSYEGNFVSVCTGIRNHMICPHVEADIGISLTALYFRLNSDLKSKYSRNLDL